MKFKLMAVLLLGLGASAVAQSGKGFVQDDLGLFSPAAVMTADEKAQKVFKETGRTIRVETRQSVTPGTSVDDYAKTRFDDQIKRGVYVLVTTEPRKITLWLDDETKGIIAPRTNDAEIRQNLTNKFKAKDFDEGLMELVNDTSSLLGVKAPVRPTRILPVGPTNRMPESRSTGSVTSPNQTGPVQSAPQAHPAQILGVWLFGIFALVIIVRSVMGAMSKNKRRNAAPGYVSSFRDAASVGTSDIPPAPQSREVPRQPQPSKAPPPPPAAPKRVVSEPTPKAPEMTSAQRSAYDTEMAEARANEERLRRQRAEENERVARRREEQARLDVVAARRREDDREERNSRRRREGYDSSTTNNVIVVPGMGSTSNDDSSSSYRSTPTPAPKEEKKSSSDDSSSSGGSSFWSSSNNDSSSTSSSGGSSDWGSSSSNDSSSSGGSSSYDSGSSSSDSGSSGGSSDW